MKLRKLILMALFIAISFIGANIKIAGTIAFDSMAGFLGTLILGPAYGALIGAAGHFLTAVTSGFPLSLPVHLIVMVDMALTMYIFGVLYRSISKKNSRLAMVIASIAGIMINGPISILMVMPIIGSGILAMLPILCLAAFLNVLIANFVYKFLPEEIKLWKAGK
ncbi:ECF transporter S component [Clostridium sp. 19966]|uniref:ECF transporter S component n=1 Tax=Clostridium sp. 19966 TaxID=2768166 RepID=UPI0028DFB91A|nr:ECF transporter S component [Clostridium sp. 19966]MDT8717361.1 ECF transporter S component [Clostridium sp. 19966]